MAQTIAHGVELSRQDSRLAMAPLFGGFLKKGALEIARRPAYSGIRIFSMAACSSMLEKMSGPEPLRARSGWINARGPSGLKALL